jgi:hypothetical protein
LEAATLVDELSAQADAGRRLDVFGVDLDDVGELFGRYWLERDGQHGFEFLFERELIPHRYPPSDVQPHWHVDPLDLHVTEGRALAERHVTELAQFQEREEVHDDLDAGAEALRSGERKESGPSAGRRWESETTVSATETASTVTWLRRTTGTGFSSMPRR